jgi:transposase
MVKRYELNDAQWRRVEAMLPGKAGDPGRTANNRLFVDGVLWVLRSVAHLHDLPERYGKGKAFTPAFRAGPRPACGSAFSRLSPKTAARISHARHSPGSRSPTGRDRKRGAQNQALGRSRGGLTTKIHMLADALGRPLRFILTGGQTHDVVTAPALLEGVDGGAIIADTRFAGVAALDDCQR